MDTNQLSLTRPLFLYQGFSSMALGMAQTWSRAMLTSLGGMVAVWTMIEKDEELQIKVCSHNQRAQSDNGASVLSDDRR